MAQGSEKVIKRVSRVRFDVSEICHMTLSHDSSVRRDEGVAKLSD